MTVLIKNDKRQFYKTIMTIAFSIDTGHHLHSFLRLFIYLFLINWIVCIVLAPISIIWLERHTLGLSMTLELIQYIMVGMLQLSTIILFIIKKEALILSYKLIENDFVESSKRNGMNENHVYKKILKLFKKLVIFFLVIMFFISFGPIISALNDEGKLPLDHRSHFILHWPRLIEMNNFKTYGIIYLSQFGFVQLVYMSAGSHNVGLAIILYELNYQYQILLYELKNAFNQKTEKKFEEHFIHCIRQHQLIIKCIYIFQSYFKWIMFVDVVCVQLTIAICIYLLTKVESSLGYQLKVIGSFLYLVSPFCFHCHIGEVILNMNKQLAEHLYNMPWYDIPRKHNKLIIIMYQRTQKDLKISLGLFSNKLASRSLILQVAKQIYTILNLILKT